MGQKSGCKSARLAKLWQFLQGHPKPAFSKKVQRGDKEKFFKNRPKSSPRLEGPKHFCGNGIILKLACSISAKTGEDFGAEGESKTARMAKLWQFLQGHPKPAFSEKKCKGGTKGNFSKIA